jgi:hypothetical protein
MMIMIGSNSAHPSTVTLRTPNHFLGARRPIDGACFPRTTMPSLVILITHTMARTCSAGNQNSENLHFYLSEYIFIYLNTFLTFYRSLHPFSFSIFLNVFGRPAPATRR